MVTAMDLTLLQGERGKGQNSSLCGCYSWGSRGTSFQLPQHTLGSASQQHLVKTVTASPGWGYRHVAFWLLCALEHTWISLKAVLPCHALIVKKSTREVNKVLAQHCCVLWAFRQYRKQTQGSEVVQSLHSQCLKPRMAAGKDTESHRNKGNMREISCSI